MTILGVPQEVLEQIAFCAATETLVGPPSRLLPLLFTCRHVHQALSFETNPFLYARIFSSKFDTRSALHRLGSHVNLPRVLANELKKRCIYLSRIKARTDARQAAESPPTLVHSLWLAYLMMLENDGRNERQLLEYAEMDGWLLLYWFDVEGASSALTRVYQRAWPVEDEKNAIAMWLFWFLVRPEFALKNVTRVRHMMTVMKLTALAANHYPVCRPPWSEFLARSEAMMSPSLVTHFSETYRLTPPSLAPAAILAFLTMTLHRLLPTQSDHATEYIIQPPASLPLATRRSEDWNADWYRSVDAGRFDHFISDTYELGSVEGFWEGIFAYTEFASYTQLLTGEPPSVLDVSLLVQHRQTWKLREYHLAEEETATSLEPGDPLLAHFPVGTRFHEGEDGVKVEEPGRDPVYYQRRHKARSDCKLMDVIVLGEGHSAWGQFTLYGRVRPLDGLISLCKEYVVGDRGRWLYRGYLVGSLDGYLSGRWRDTLTPSDVEGYEGCFVMGRRR